MKYLLLSLHSDCQGCLHFPCKAPTVRCEYRFTHSLCLALYHLPPPPSYLLTSPGDSQNTLIIWISGASNLLFTLSHASEKPGADRCTRNPKWQFWPPEVRSLQQNLVQPPGEMSGAPYGAGKINNKMKITAAAGSRNFWKKKKMKFKDEEREVIN